MLVNRIRNCDKQLIELTAVLHFVGYFSEISSNGDILDRVQVNYKFSVALVNISMFLSFYVRAR